MKLVDKLKNSRGYYTPLKILGIAGYIGLVALGSFNVGVKIKDINVLDNREPDAIYARNGRAKVKNEDLDKNGKYESVLYYTFGNEERSFLLQYDPEKGLETLAAKPYKIETQYDSLKNKESKTIKILE